MPLKVEEATVIDFTLTAQQRDLQLTSRKFAKEVLNAAKAAELLSTPEERFLATKPTYEAMVAAGYLRKCIPAPAGGENAGLIDMAIIAEEFYSVNASVTLTMLGTVLGLLPLLLGGSPEQCMRLLGPFLKTGGAPLAGFCSSEPGGSANAASPPPGEGVRTTARKEGDNWVINGRKKWVSSATGWNREGANLLCVVCRTDPAAPPDTAISIIAVEGPVKGIVFERAIDTIGHRAHLVPQFGLQNVATPHHNLLGQEGSGLALTGAAFTGTAALVGILGVALMRAAFDFALHFARTEKRGGVHPIKDHDRSGTLSQLAGLPRARYPVAGGRGACRSGQDFRLRGRGARDHRSDARGWHRQLRSRGAVRSPAAGCARAADLRRRQYGHPAAPAAHAVQAKRL